MEIATVLEREGITITAYAGGGAGAPVGFAFHST